jgi:hypothetical protein
MSGAGSKNQGSHHADANQREQDEYDIRDVVLLFMLSPYK